MHKTERYIVLNVIKFSYIVTKKQHIVIKKTNQYSTTDFHITVTLPKTLGDRLMLWSLSEAFIRRSWY